MARRKTKIEHSIFVMIFVLPCRTLATVGVGTWYWSRVQYQAPGDQYPCRNIQNMLYSIGLLTSPHCPLTYATRRVYVSRGGGAPMRIYWRPTVTAHYSEYGIYTSRDRATVLPPIATTHSGCNLQDSHRQRHRGARHSTAWQALASQRSGRGAHGRDMGA